MRARRALLYMPGNEIRKIQKAAALDVDSACLDLEDGVALNRKQEARSVVVEALRTLDFGRTERLVRINAIGSGMEEEDLQAALTVQPDGIVLPKVADAEQVRWVSRKIADAEEARGWEPDSVRLLVLVESARGVQNLPSIAASDARLDAIILGAEDFAADVGAIRTREGLEVLYARSALVIACAAAGLQAIDVLNVDFKDLEQLRRDAQQGAQMGFAGKQIIHPNQIEPVQEAFTPDEASIAEAQRIVEAAAQHQTAGAGAFALDGKMVDRPVVKAAERILLRARAAGKVL